MPEIKRLILLLLVIAASSCNSQNDQQTVIASDTTNINNLEKELKKYPDSLLLGQSLIAAYRNQGNYDSAISLTKRFILSDTGNAYLWNIMATLSYETGDTTGTIHSLEKAVEIFPLPDYYAALGTVYAEKKDSRALLIADALLSEPEAGNTVDDAYFIKGLYYNYSEQFEKAIPELDSAISLNYTFMFAYREKAIALYNLKQYQKALQVLHRAVLLQNSYDEGYYWMGQVYEKLNEKDSAILSYQNALLYDNHYSEARRALDKLTKK